jgi:glutathione peroxidase
MNSRFKLAAVFSVLILIAVGISLSSADHHESDSSIYQFIVTDLDGNSVGLSEYQGKTLLIVNVASKCGYTPQYEGLQKVYEKYKEMGFLVLGFPANNFGNQEPGSNEDIKEFCSLNYGVTFPMFSKISVKGEDIHPLYQFLTSEESNPEYAGEISWNFNKFLINPSGKVIARFASKVKPQSEKVIKSIEMALK